MCACDDVMHFNVRTREDGTKSPVPLSEALNHSSVT